MCIRDRNSTGPTRSCGVVSSTGRMKSFCGSGLYCSTSIGPSVSVTCSNARAIAPVSRTSAANPRAWTPSFARVAARASSRSWLREIRPTVKPSAPNLRATARPNPWPAPMIAMLVMEEVYPPEPVERYQSLLPGTEPLMVREIDWLHKHWWWQVGVLEGVFDLVSGQYFALFVEDDQGESGLEFTLLPWCGEVDVFFVAAVHCPLVGEFESAASVCSDVEEFAV